MPYQITARSSPSCPPRPARPAGRRTRCQWAGRVDEPPRRRCHGPRPGRYLTDLAPWARIGSWPARCWSRWLLGCQAHGMAFRSLPPSSFPSPFSALLALASLPPPTSVVRRQHPPLARACEACGLCWSPRALGSAAVLPTHGAPSAPSARELEHRLHAAHARFSARGLPTLQAPWQTRRCSA